MMQAGLSMKHIRTWSWWGLAVSAIILSPVAVILAVPMAIGIGLDVFDFYGETPILLTLSTPPAMVLLRRFSAGPALRRTAARLWSRLRLDHAANLIHAP
jgi:hypothetical protein